MMITTDGLTAKIRRAQEKDLGLMQLRENLKYSNNNNNYEEKNGIIYKYQDGNELLVIPKNREIEVIRNIHEFGHFGTVKTKELIKNNYWIPTLEKKIRNVIGNCIPCILTNAKIGKLLFNINNEV